MDLYAAGCGNEGSGARGGGDIRPPPPEHRRLVYCHLDNTGAMSDGGATAMGAGVDEMVGAGWNRHRPGRDGDRDEYREGGGI